MWKVLCSLTSGGKANYARDHDIIKRVGPTKAYLLCGNGFKKGIKSFLRFRVSRAGIFLRLICGGHLPAGRQACPLRIPGTQGKGPLAVSLCHPVRYLGARLTPCFLLSAGLRLPPLISRENTAPSRQSLRKDFTPFDGNNRSTIKVRKNRMNQIFKLLPMIKKQDVCHFTLIRFYYGT